MKKIQQEIIAAIRGKHAFFSKANTVVKVFENGAIMLEMYGKEIIHRTTNGDIHIYNAAREYPSNTVLSRINAFFAAVGVQKRAPQKRCTGY